MDMKASRGTIATLACALLMAGCAGTPEHTAEPILRQHAVETIRALADVLKEQHASVRWIERERCPQ